MRSAILQEAARAFQGLRLMLAGSGAVLANAPPRLLLIQMLLFAGLLACVVKRKPQSGKSDGVLFWLLSNRTRSSPY